MRDDTPSIIDIALKRTCSAWMVADGVRVACERPPQHRHDHASGLTFWTNGDLVCDEARDDEELRLPLEP